MKNELNSTKVTLRDVMDDDLPEFFRHQLDAEANRLAAFVARNPEDEDAFMAHWAKIRSEKSVRNKTIVIEGQVAGHIASYLDASFGKREVTYWIGREYWGRGIATKALAEFLLLETTRPIHGRAAKDNYGSIRVLEKNGFILTGYNRAFANGRGEEIEEVIMKLE